MTNVKTIALTRRTIVDKVMCLLLNMLSRLAITFLPRIKRLLISLLFLNDRDWQFSARQMWLSTWFCIVVSWCWEELGAEGEGKDRVWDGWMASPTQWTWVWVKSESWWWTGRPGVLQFMGLLRVGHDWATELNWTELNSLILVAV